MVNITKGNLETFIYMMEAEYRGKPTDVMKYKMWGMIGTLYQLGLIDVKRKNEMYYKVELIQIEMQTP